MLAVEQSNLLRGPDDRAVRYAPASDHPTPRPALDPEDLASPLHRLAAAAVLSMACLLVFDEGAEGCGDRKSGDPALPLKLGAVGVDDRFLVLFEEGIGRSSLREQRERAHHRGTYHANPPHCSGVRVPGRSHCATTMTTRLFLTMRSPGSSDTTFLLLPPENSGIDHRPDLSFSPPKDLTSRLVVDTT
jgi:hypothetical protein